MQDAAGAWVKTRVARAILMGGEIRNVRQFFDYCMAYLTMQAEFQGDQKGGAVPFTSSHLFYLLETEELALFRANAEQVETWSKARLCHFFWAGSEENEVGRKWMGCACSSCLVEDFKACKQAHLFLVDGVDTNAPLVARLVANAPQARTREEDIAQSLKVPRSLLHCTHLKVAVFEGKRQGCSQYCRRHSAW